jgi:hypothetical protein
MAYQFHFLAGTKPSRYSSRELDKFGLCGENSSVQSYTEKPDLIECPKCSAKWASAEIAKQDRKITLVKSDTNLRGYRSIYNVLVDGEHYAYATLEGGKRARWELRDHDYERPAEKIPSKTNEFRTYDKPYIQSRKSKEHAALDILSFMEHFKTHDDWVAQREADNNEYAMRAKAMEDRRKRENEDYDMSVAVLTEMRAREGVTNEDAYALEVALKALKEVLRLNRR